MDCRIDCKAVRADLDTILKNPELNKDLTRAVLLIIRKSAKEIRAQIRTKKIK